ncbi:MAG: carboxylating nicotinate-nucleotide diphosphorylase [Methanomicrobiaceae archaeon]|nr:carboxylating nicotinate-nucleotide diphosphorylase [Methanomicrobiaceae archaeon]
MEWIEDLVRFVREDAPFGDVTTEAVVPDTTCVARVQAKQDGIIAGIAETAALFFHFGVTVRQLARDGSRVHEGQVLMELAGTASAILLVERTALDLIGRMSGIATRTRAMVDIARAVNPKVAVAATRKTCPGLRMLDKKAVVLGGGEPHRLSLSDQFLIKDNHLVLVSMEQAIRAGRARSRYKTIEVEVGSAGDAVRAAAAGADIVMLDNMTPGEVQAALDRLQERGLRDRVAIEVSGGIDKETIAEFAGLDVDVISIGALTHSVTNFDASLTVLPGERTVFLS